MSELTSLQAGLIIQARVKPKHGQEKVRPGLILTPTEDIQKGEPIVCLAITGSPLYPCRPEYVPVPWARNGHVSTGLRKPSFVVCNWSFVICASQVVSVKGFLPKKYLTEIYERLNLR